MASANHLATLRQNVIEKIEKWKQLDRGMKGLEKGQKAALGQIEAEKSILDREIHEITISYSKASCRQLCTQVITKLPRELRDIITSHVVTADYIYVGPQYLANKGSPCEKDRDAHFFQESYVGDMLVEIAQAWYRHTLFYFWDKERNADVVERFMVTDRWCLGIKPHEHISRVRFDLGSNTLHSSNNCRRLTHAFCDVDNFHSLLVGPLKALAQFPIPNRAHFTIRIHTLGSFAEGCLSQKALQVILEDLLTELRGLRAVGHHFVVRWSELSELEFSSSSGDTKKTMTAEEWLKMIRLVCRVV